MRNNFGFILIKPQLGENIGACARSMKNFGFSKLNIVSPKFSFPNHKTKVTSVGAYDIINNTKVFKNTEEVIKKYDLLISFSARKRDINKRNRTFESVSDQYYSTVRPMHEQFVVPTKKYADIIIPEGGKNHVAIDILRTKMKALLNERKNIK